MTPDECPSMRSIARWVFPVLVGPSTAVTPAPRARVARADCGEKLMAITRLLFLVVAGLVPAVQVFPGYCSCVRRGSRGQGQVLRRWFVYHNATTNRRAVKF